MAMQKLTQSMFISAIIYMLIASTYCQQQGCSIPLPSGSLVQTILRNLYINQVGDNDAVVTLEQFAYTCQAVSSRGRYRSLSVVARFTASSTLQFGQFQLNCLFDDWDGSDLVLLDESIFTIPLHVNCSSCTKTDANRANCVACDPSCQGVGQGACTGPGSSDCCPYFNSTTGECITSCEVYDPDTFECVCNLQCSMFGQLNETNCQCICSEGYTGEDCSIDINECDNDPCKNGATCMNEVGGYICICSGGFTGVNCDVDIDECGSNPCQNGATCEDEVDGYICICSGGFTGVNCDVNIDECSSGPCQNGATCEDEIDGYICICSGGFTGVNCDVDIDECSSGPCQNGATCEDEVDGYICICSAGFTGVNCDVDIDECSSGPCQNGATCEDEVNEYICICRAGFTGVNCDVDIDECSSGPCQNGATCEDEVDGYICICSAGFTGVNCDVDIDECSSGPCQNGATCEDEVNGYICICSAGFTGVNCDVDINECGSNPCQNGATCEDEVSGYNCICSPGFTGKNCVIDINECDSNPCLNGATCINEIAEYSCICSPGFTGENCAMDINECLSSPCENGGTCINLSPFYSCVCDAFFTGLRCEASLIFDRCDAICQDPNIFDRDICKFYCHLKEWRQIASQSGINLPEIKENTDKSIPIEERWEEALMQQKHFSRLWSTYSNDQGLVVDDSGGTNTEESDNLIKKWESQFSETRDYLRLWRQHSISHEPGLKFASLEKYSIDKDTNSEELSAIYNRYSNEWSEDLTIYATKFEDHE